MSVSDGLKAVDRFQQRHRRLSFVVAVVKKFGDDQAGSLAALISYYGFISLFPLILLFVTILGFVIQGDPSETQKILHGTLGQFPVISNQLSVKPIKGSVVGIVVGVLGALSGGLGVTGAAQNAFNRVWHVPFRHRPNFIKSRLRSLGTLAVLAVLNIVSTVAAGFVGASTHGPAAVVGGVAVALLVNIALFTAAFMLLTAADVSWREQLPGIIVAAIGWQILQHLGGAYAKKAGHDTALYGSIALVLGLLAWLYVGAQITIFAAEVNVVRTRRLWPRSFFGPPLTDADRRSLTSSAEIEERVEHENVEVSFDETEGDARAASPSGADGGSPPAGQPSPGHRTRSP